MESIIKEKQINDYPFPISVEETKKILEQMEKCICKIYFNGENGTGFFCKIYFPSLKKKLKFLITAKHVFDLTNKSNKKITLEIDNGRIIKNIDLNEKRIIYTKEEYDITMIELNDKDNINNFLELEEEINKDYIENIFEKKSIYVLHYPLKKEVCVSYGILKTIESKDKIKTLICSDYGSSGGPILLLSTQKVIGIHKGAFKNEDYNIGTFLKYPLKELELLIINNINHENDNEPKDGRRKIEKKKKNIERSKSIDNFNKIPKKKKTISQIMRNIFFDNYEIHLIKKKKIVNSDIQDLLSILINNKKEGQNSIIYFIENDIITPNILKNLSNKSFFILKDNISSILIRCDMIDKKDSLNKNLNQLYNSYKLKLKKAIEKFRNEFRINEETISEENLAKILRENELDINKAFRIIYG